MGSKSGSYVTALTLALVVALAGAAAAGPVGQPNQPGQVFRDCSDCPEMVVISAGSFLMGASEAEMQNEIQGKPSDDAELLKRYFRDERPQHEVTIARPFALGRYLVTRGEFAAFVRDSGYSTKAGCVIYEPPLSLAP
jgi:formylglycine-generating enzyme required for sulfatase activity